MSEKLLKLLKRMPPSPDEETFNRLARELTRSGYPIPEKDRGICPFCTGMGTCEVSGPVEEDIALNDPLEEWRPPQTYRASLPTGSFVEVLPAASFPRPTLSPPPENWRERLENWRIVAELSRGYSHIAVDDHCYVLLNGGRMSAWWFREALDILRTLPENPEGAQQIEIVIPEEGGNEA